MEICFPEGYGIMEVHGLNAELIDVAVYTQQALQATANVAGILKEPEEQKKYRELALTACRQNQQGFLG